MIRFIFGKPLALHRGIIPYAGTFLVFSDYARNAVRLAAMMQAHVIYLYSHDSIGLGEDGPTHQPITQLASLRMMPGLNVWRPGDDVETAVAWQQILAHHGPSCIVLTRQTVAHQSRDVNALANIARGGYVLLDAKGTPDVIVIATGSEVALAMEAATQLQAKKVNVRVVSMPCYEIFQAQDESYRESVLPSAIKKRIVIEAGSPDGWYQLVGSEGRVIGMTTFGASAPYQDVFKAYGFTVENVVETINDL